MKRFDKLTELIGEILFWGILFLVNMQIIFRFVIRISVPWTEEISRMIFIYLVFMGAAISVRKGEMIIVDTIPNLVKGKSRKALNFVITVFNLLLSAVMLVSSIQMFRISYTTRFSTVRWMSNGWLYVPLIFSFAMMMFHYLQCLVRFRAKRDEEEK